MSKGYQALTEKEKQTLRLIVRGYDAKSMARHLGLSIHTINERLRHARRKMAVSSSREAARLLLDKEGDSPNFLADKQLGEAETAYGMRQIAASNDGLRTRHRLTWVIGGVLIVSLTIATLVLSSISQIAATPAGMPEAAPGDAAAMAESDVVRLARQWLALVDEERWSDSWNATGQSFKKLNTSEKWASVSAEVRPPLGAVLSRIASGQESVPAPPHGYEMVRFRTSFANKLDAIETVTLVREGPNWKVVGYWISGR